MRRAIYYVALLGAIYLTWAETMCVKEIRSRFPRLRNVDSDISFVKNYVEPVQLIMIWENKVQYKSFTLVVGVIHLRNLLTRSLPRSFFPIAKLQTRRKWVNNHMYWFFMQTITCLMLIGWNKRISNCLVVGSGIKSVSQLPATRHISWPKLLAKTKKKVSYEQIFIVFQYYILFNQDYVVKEVIIA